MASERRVLEIDLRSKKPSARRYDALLEALRSSSATALDDLVRQAMRHFESGSDPDIVYKEFDVERFALILATDRKGGAEALSAFRGREENEQLAACMFLSTAIITINNTDPHLARLVLAQILRRAAGDAELEGLSNIVMLGIVHTAYSIPQPESEQSLMSLADCCVKRLNR